MKTFIARLRRSKLTKPTLNDTDTVTVADEKWEAVLGEFDRQARLEQPISFREFIRQSENSTKNGRSEGGGKSPQQCQLSTRISTHTDDLDSYGSDRGKETTIRKTAIAEEAIEIYERQEGQEETLEVKEEKKILNSMPTPTAPLSRRKLRLNYRWCFAASAVTLSILVFCTYMALELDPCDAGPIWAITGSLVGYWIGVL